jgi:hypothetical protein
MTGIVSKVGIERSERPRISSKNTAPAITDS